MQIKTKEKNENKYIVLSFLFSNDMIWLDI